MAAKTVPGLKAFFTFQPAPAALIVDIFLREKGLGTEDIKAIERFVDLPNLENRGPECSKLNPQGSLPFFQLTSGKVISETIAMCEYVEEQIPEPALVGRDAEERGQVRMWQRRMEEHFCLPAVYAHRSWCHSGDCPDDHFMKNFYTKRLFADQGGNLLPQAWKDLAAWARNRIVWLERVKQAEPSEFLCGDRLSMADIQLYVNIWYWDTFPPGQPILKELSGQLPWVQAWYDRIHARSAVVAARHHAGYKERADKADVESTEAGK